MRTDRRVAIVAALAVVAATGVALQALAGSQPRTKLVSKTSTGEAATGNNSGSASISASGRHVAFHSRATNLPGADGFTKVYVHDAETGKTRLVSQTSAGDPAAGGNSSSASISATGRHVAFFSSATNLPGDNPYGHVYLRDRRTGKTTLVSKTSTGDEAIDGASDDPSISSTGRYVAFHSSAVNLPGDNNYTNVYVRDRKAGKTKLVSKSSAGVPATDGGSRAPSISSSGRFVAFQSDATNLPGDDPFTDVYVHDLETGQTKLVSRTSRGRILHDDSGHPSISSSGRFVAFTSNANSLPGNDDVTGTYVRDRRTGKTELVSRNSAGQPVDGSSTLPSISASGRFVAFQVQGFTNLPGDQEFANVYVRDRATGQTKLVSRNSAGDPALGGHSDEASISTLGPFVAFDSAADNLPGDTNFANVYRRGPLD